MQLAFISAIAFHHYCKSYLKEIYLKEFCNYKLFVETFGVFLCHLGILFTSYFPSHAVILGYIILIAIVRFNFLIFRRKKLYAIEYQPPEIPKTPLVSIVIIAYNEEKFIARLLESVRKQDYQKFEVIIVDDSSTDRTVEIAKGYQDLLPLRIVQKDIRGISRSRNYGASFASGEVILFLDGDVVIPHKFISDNLAAFIEQQLSIAGVDFTVFSKNKIDKLIIPLYRAWLKIVQYFNPRGIGFSLFVHRELHQKVLFDESVIMSEDFDYVKRAVKYGKFRILSNVLLGVSWRRFQNENRLLLILKYLFFEWYRQNIGEIRKKILPYEFGSLSKVPNK